MPPIGRCRVSAEEQGFAAQLQAILSDIKGTIQTLFYGEKAINWLAKKFEGMEEHIDGVFDEKVQELARHSLTQPQINANKVVGQVQQILHYLIPVYFLVALLIGGLLVMTIVRPLRRLALGTKAIGGGDLNYRVAERGRDEFGALARQFNRMVVQLQESTVSRQALERSEQQLRQTVAELRREIHEREASERKREKLQAELQRSEAMAATGRLVAGVAHEVRNPLFGISSTLDAIEANADIGSVDGRFREVLRREVNRLKNLMSDLLEYGKPPTNEFASEKLVRVVAEAIETCGPTAQAARVQQVNNISDDGLLRMNQDRMLQVFVNLIDNAVRFAPEDTDVVVTTQSVTGADGQHCIECRVMDSGAGFAEEDLPHIFDPFFSRRRKGTGLGLAIVRRIADEHGANIEAANRPEGGAVVSVRLPLVTAGDEDAESASTAP